jgi:hypothetical protein
LKAGPPGAAAPSARERLVTNPILRPAIGAEIRAIPLSLAAAIARRAGSELQRFASASFQEGFEAGDGEATSHSASWSLLISEWSRRHWANEWQRPLGTLLRRPHQA